MSSPAFLHLSDLPFCHPQDATEIIDMYDYDNAPRGSLFGVDLSKEMVKVSEEERSGDEIHTNDSSTLSTSQLANAKNCYTSVALADCDDFLKAQGDSSADVIVSADTYIYMGDIDTSLKESARVLKTGGYLVFSVELVPNDTKDGYLLLPSGRYGQSKAYVESLAEKFSFEVEHAEDIVVRKEQGEDIGGCIYILSMSK
jgi:predicted TPR repeat methyltransferase